MKREITVSTTLLGMILAWTCCGIWNIATVYGQSREPIQPASQLEPPAPLPLNHAASERPNPLRNTTPAEASSAVPSPVRLASGQFPDEPQKLSLNDFPEPPASGQFLETAGFANEPGPSAAQPVAQPAARAVQRTQAQAAPPAVPNGDSSVLPHPGFASDAALAPPPGNGSLFGADPFGDKAATPGAAPGTQPIPVATASPAAQPAPQAVSPFAAAGQAPPAQTPFAQAPPAQPAPAQAVPAQAAPAVRETARQQPVKQEPVRQAPAQQAPAQQELAKQEPAKQVPVRSQPTPEPRQLATFQAATPQVRGNAKAAPVQAGEGSGIPGPKSIHGIQTAQIQIEKVFPAEVQVNQQATLRIVVKNIGKTTAEEVVLTDQVPQGTRLVSTTPQAGMQDGSDLAWELGAIEPGKEAAVEMQVVPLREGEIGSVARVMFVSSASGKVAATRPMLKVEVNAPKEVLIGETVNFDIILSNPGTGTATGVVLEEFIPEGLYHKDGKQLLNKIGKLKPKETLKLSLPLQAVTAGKIANRLIVRADNNLSAEEKTVVDVLAPVLQLKIEGAKSRYLDRKAAYRLTVANPGTASASNVDLVCHLPTSMQFVSTNQSGLYEASTHTVHWALEELPAGEAGQIELVALPIKSGEHKLKFAGSGQDGLKGEVAHDVLIDGLASVSFSVSCLSDLVEVGKDTVYEISVVNRGTKASTNVVVGVQLSKGMSFVAAEGPVKYKSDEGIVQFNPLGKIDPKSEKTYRVTARCLDDGDHRISVKLISDDLQAPITKEESTRVIK